MTALDSERPEIERPTTARVRSRGRSLPIALGVGLVCSLLIGALLARLGADEPERTDPLIGELVPELVGETLDGGTYDLDARQGNWVVVNFFSTWCPGCIAEHPELVEFSRRHRGSDREVVSVIFEDDPEAVAAFFAEAGGDWPVVLDDGSRSVRFAVTRVPETFVVAPSGYVVASFDGEITAAQLDSVIDGLTDAR